MKFVFAILAGLHFGIAAWFFSGNVEGGLFITAGTVVAIGSLDLCMRSHT